MAPGETTLCLSGRSLFVKVDYTRNGQITMYEMPINSEYTYHRTRARGVVNDFLPDELLFPLLLEVAGHVGF